MASSKRAGLALALAVALVAAGAACTSRKQGVCVDGVSSALRTCPGPDTVDGLDVSSWQGSVDFARVAADGRAFVFVRAASGQNVDVRFAQNWPAARAAGLVRGAYQYFYPSRDVDTQVDALLAELRREGFEPDDLPPVLDLETLDGLTAAEVVARAQHWLARVEAELHVRPMVYTANFMSAVIDTHFSAYPLWVANYGASCPLMPTGWTEWRFWQTSSTGSIDGVSGNVDTDLFNGTLADLRAFAAASHLPAADAGAPDDAAEGGAPEEGGASDAGPDASGAGSSHDAAPSAPAPGAEAPAPPRAPVVVGAPRVRAPATPPDPCAPPR